MFGTMRYGGAIRLGFTALVAWLPAPGRAADHETAPVPPTLEIEVLDPNVDPLGNPAVIVRPDGYGGSIVDIPPVVLVHRYFYTGDRSFQGPMLPGGPSIIVLSHPKTGERCYVPVQMLPGAPMVHYTRGAIEYDYGRNGITLSFGLFGKPKVTYRNCVPASRRAKHVVTGAAAVVGKTIEHSGLPELTRATAQGTRNLAVNTKNGVGNLGGRIVSPFVQLINATPLGSLLCNNPEQQAQHQRDCENRQAARRQNLDAAWLPTVR